MGARIIAASGAAAKRRIDAGPDRSTIEMTDEIENLVLEQLRLLRNEIQSLRREVRDDIADLKFRFGNVERLMLSQQSELVRHNAKFDEIDEKLRIVQRRLEIRDEH